MSIVTAAPMVHFEPVHSSLVFNEPVQVLFDGVDEGTMYVVEKSGRILIVSTEKSTKDKKVFLDITDRVGVTNDEEGLLSLAFHPDYAENGELYVWYSAQNPKRGVLSRFSRGEDEITADKSSERVILEVREPWGNHNGGTVLFGPDGMLYLGIGDGGAANDPHNNGQNKNTLLGSIIRIDINNSTPEKPYTIPPDNPLVGVSGTSDELWAWGLRNPWRMSFDRATGKLWTGDVGQNAWEEVDIIERGGNYGWKLREGRHEFRNTGGEIPITIDPVHEYGRRSGGSITGGYVYRGTEIPELVGTYIFSDYLSRKIWILRRQEGEESEYESVRIARKTPVAIASFGETPSGEILACGFPNPYAPRGRIYRLSASASSKPTTPIIR
jgi:glucose/arabinose dehydrogenase